jgi:hypothetical protein
MDLNTNQPAGCDRAAQRLPQQQGPSQTHDDQWPNDLQNNHTGWASWASFRENGGWWVGRDCCAGNHTIPSVGKGENRNWQPAENSTESCENRHPRRNLPILYATLLL